MIHPWLNRSLLNQVSKVKDLVIIIEHKRSDGRTANLFVFMLPEARHYHKTCFNTDLKWRYLVACSQGWSRCHNPPPLPLGFFCNDLLSIWKKFRVYDKSKMNIPPFLKKLSTPLTWTTVIISYRTTAIFQSTEIFISE
jgi:hypothetical protein